MRLASDQCHPQVHHRLAGNSPVQLLSNALFHTRDVLTRNGSADHLVDELEPAPFGQRLHLDVGDGELAVPA